MMIEKKDVSVRQTKSGNWLLYAVGSAVFASLTSILGKVGISGVESNLGTAIRTGVVLLRRENSNRVFGKNANSTAGRLHSSQQKSMSYPPDCHKNLLWTSWASHPVSTSAATFVATSAI